MLKHDHFPLGSAFDAEAAARDPYPVLARMREAEPVSWVAAFEMYYVTRYADVAAILRDDVNFHVGGENMLVYDTFGRHMMTIDGPDQRRFRLATRAPFTPKLIRQALEARVEALVIGLVEGLLPFGEADLRSAFAARLPVQVMLAVFGLPPEDEPLLRRWYDAFESALANYSWDDTIRAHAKVEVAAFKAHLANRLNETPEHGLLAALAAAPSDDRLSDEEILQNALIIFFGGISTVEALILNTLYALALHPDSFARVAENLKLLPNAIEETARWLSPVQAATRLVAHDVELHGVMLRKGELVNCMLGSANRDPSKFASADVFDLDRSDGGQHLAFATGPHLCLGSHLARTEANIALSHLLRLPGFSIDLDRSAGPTGYEFRQPSRLVARWRSGPS